MIQCDHWRPPFEALPACYYADRGVAEATRAGSFIGAYRFSHMPVDLVTVSLRALVTSVTGLIENPEQSR
jgi:hypothetical protein